jgi:hypothetical protein
VAAYKSVTLSNTHDTLLPRAAVGNGTVPHSIQDAERVTGVRSALSEYLVPIALVKTKLQ